MAYHDNLQDLRRTKGNPTERAPVVDAQKRIHRDLAKAKSKVNALRITLGAENQNEALEALGTNGSATAAMRALTRQIGSMEHIVTVLFQYLDNPEDETWGKVLKATNKFRKNFGRVES